MAISEGVMGVSLHPLYLPIDNIYLRTLYPHLLRGSTPSNDHYLDGGDIDDSSHMDTSVKAAIQMPTKN